MHTAVNSQRPAASSGHLPNGLPFYAGYHPAKLVLHSCTNPKIGLLIAAGHQEKEADYVRKKTGNH